MDFFFSFERSGRARARVSDDKNSFGLGRARIQNLRAQAVPGSNSSLQGSYEETMERYVSIFLELQLDPY